MDWAKQFHCGEGHTHTHMEGCGTHVVDACYNPVVEECACTTLCPTSAPDFGLCVVLACVQ